MESHPQAAKQAPTSVILQRYLNKTVQKEAVPDEDELVQGKFYGTAQMASLDEDGLPLQAKSGNRTGLPDNLKSGIENLSGLSMDDVRVHYNSPKPAQLHALAYTQGTDIHVAPGQEKHLGHEAWHVVQQKQGRVQPTMQLQGVSVNDDEGLEKEADRMGGEIQKVKSNANRVVIQGEFIREITEVIQRCPRCGVSGCKNGEKCGFPFEAIYDPPPKEQYDPSYSLSTRSMLYHSSFDSGVKKTVCMLFSKKDPQGYIMVYCTSCRKLFSFSDITLDHEPSLSERFNEEEYKWSRAQRKKSFNDTRCLKPMCRSCNSRKGGEDYDPYKVQMALSHH